MCRFHLYPGTWLLGALLTFLLQSWSRGGMAQPPALMLPARVNRSTILQSPSVGILVNSHSGHHPASISCSSRCQSQRGIGQSPCSWGTERLMQSPLPRMLASTQLSLTLGDSVQEIYRSACQRVRGGWASRLRLSPPVCSPPSDVRAN